MVSWILAFWHNVNPWQTNRISTPQKTLSLSPGWRRGFSRKVVASGVNQDCPNNNLCINCRFPLFLWLCGCRDSGQCDTCTVVENTVSKHPPISCPNSDAVLTCGRISASRGHHPDKTRKCPPFPCAAAIWMTHLRSLRAGTPAPSPLTMRTILTISLRGGTQKHGPTISKLAVPLPQYYLSFMS